MVRSAHAEICLGLNSWETSTFTHFPSGLYLFIHNMWLLCPQILSTAYRPDWFLLAQSPAVGSIQDKAAFKTWNIWGWDLLINKLSVETSIILPGILEQHSVNFILSMPEATLFTTLTIVLRSKLSEIWAAQQRFWAYQQVKIAQKRVFTSIVLSARTYLADHSSTFLLTSERSSTFMLHN